MEMLGVFPTYVSKFPLKVIESVRMLSNTGWDVTFVIFSTWEGGPSVRAIPPFRFLNTSNHVRNNEVCTYLLPRCAVCPNPRIATFILTARPRQMPVQSVHLKCSSQSISMWRAGRLKGSLLRTKLPILMSLLYSFLAFLMRALYFQTSGKALRPSRL